MKFTRSLLFFTLSLFALNSFAGIQAYFYLDGGYVSTTSLNIPPRTVDNDFRLINLKSDSQNTCEGALSNAYQKANEECGGKWPLIIYLPNGTSCEQGPFVWSGFSTHIKYRCQSSGPTPVGLP